MPMLLYVPVVVGVPVSCPVVVLNVAHEGLLMTAKDGLTPVETVAEGVNEYLLLTATLVAGVPDIVTVVVATALALARSAAAAIKGPTRARQRRAPAHTRTRLMCLPFQRDQGRGRRDTSGPARGLKERPRCKSKKRPPAPIDGLPAVSARQFLRFTEAAVSRPPRRVSPSSGRTAAQCPAAAPICVGAK